MPNHPPAQRFIMESQKGIPGGVATLGSDGKVPAAQLPAGTGTGGSSAPAIPAGAKAVYAVVHGANASAARPTADITTTLYLWVGSVPPVNMAGDDQWVNTAP